MKILCVSDTVVQQMENAAHLRRRYSDIELIVSCGDLPAHYLEYLTSILNVPLFFVRGNHDTQYTERPPGGDDLHMHLRTYRGVSFFGIEGSVRYSSSAIQYSQGEMRRMTWRAMLRMMPRRLRTGRGVDVFVAHAPAKGIHDREDLPHNGIAAFLPFMRVMKPRYMLHGHTHTWDNRDIVRTQYEETCVMNINPVTVLEID
ncbi:MAG: metallophosphoesterase family protein [Anaerolineae bacterium]|nr:metallophosphoesterase family protein [Anaerolineae bacterium]NUQ05006.1 metallophosphoesterase [Anaerolineae bacterium]